MKRLTLLCLFCAALLFVGCASSDQANTGNTNQGSTSLPPSSSPKPAETGAAVPPTTGAIFGIASCDEYMAKVEKCVNSPKVPEAAKAAYRQSLEQNRVAWRQAASTPQGKAGLETSCRTALEAAKSFLDTCN